MAIEGEDKKSELVEEAAGGDSSATEKQQAQEVDARTAYLQEVLPHLEILAKPDATTEEKAEANEKINTIRGTYTDEYGVDTEYFDSIEKGLAEQAQEQGVDMFEEYARAQAKGEADALKPLKAAVTADLATKAATLGFSTFQFVKGLKEEERLKGEAPEAPTPLEPDPVLMQEIEQARTRASAGFPEVTRAAELSGERASKAIIEKGKSAALPGFVSAVQAGELEKFQGLKGAAFQEQQLKAQAATRLDRLLGMKLQESQAIQRSKERPFYQSELPQYQAQLGTAQQLGSTGLQNILNVTAGIPRSVYSYAQIADSLDRTQQ